VAAIVLITAAAAPTPARAQASPEVPSATELAQLRERVSSELWVYRDSQPIHGYLSRLTNEEITLVDEDKQEQIIPLDSIWRIDRSGDPVWNGFAIGAALGVGQWLLIRAELSGHLEQQFSTLLYSAGLCGLVGAGVDALHVGQSTVYRAPRRKPGVSIAPSADGRGALLSWGVRF